MGSKCTPNDSYVAASTCDSHQSVQNLGEEFITANHDDHLTASSSANSLDQGRSPTREDVTPSLSMSDFSLPFSRSNSATVPLITAACSPSGNAQNNGQTQNRTVIHQSTGANAWCCGAITRCLCKWRGYVPSTLRAECWKLIGMAWPIVVTQFLQFSLQLTGAVFCGHLGRLYLDAVALGNMVLNTAGMSVLIGLACACDTLFAQTYGSENKRQLGVVVQRSVLVLLLCCLPCWAVLINTEHLLTAVRQDGQTARLAGQYAMASLPVLPGGALQLVCTKYLQSQGIVIPSMVIFFVVNVANFGLHALLVFGLGLGVVGSGVSISISYWLLFVLHLISIRVSRVYEHTWEGWDSLCLQHWGQFYRLALPGLLMVCLQWWCFEMFTFLAGLLSTTELAAHTIVYQLSVFVFMVPLGVSVSVCIRVGSSLGSGNTTAAIASSRAALSLIGIWSVVVGAVVLAAKDVFPSVFTSDSSVTELASRLIPVMCLLQIGDAIQVMGATILGPLARSYLSAKCVGCGVVLGCGRQTLGAVIHLITYYSVATPVSALLMFLTPLRIIGTWWGLTICTTCQAVTFTFIVLRTNWVKVTAEAQNRVGVENNDICRTLNLNSGVVNAGSTTGETDRPDDSTETTISTASPRVHQDGNSCGCEACGTDRCTCEAFPRHRRSNHRGRNVQTACGSNEDILTTKQLITRRLSTVALCCMVLLAGIVVNISLRPSETPASSCILVSGSEVNETWLTFQIHHRESFQRMSPEDQRLLNLTFWYEMNHHWNKTFLYCGGTIEEPDPSTPSRTLNLTRVYSHLALPPRPSG